MMIKCGVHNLNGKMGRVLTELLSSHSSMTLSAGFVRRGHEWSGQKIVDVSGVNVGQVRATSNLDMFCAASDVIIDFAHPEATLELLPVCRKMRKPLLIGTTGFTAKTRDWIVEAAKDIPIVLAANTSIGVNVLIEVTRQVARVLNNSDWHADILELHHQHKVDAPSGTALRLGEIIAQAQNGDFETMKVYPYTHRRGEQAIGFAALRAGEIVGEHTVYFTHADERLELTHRAHDRRIFAQGALLAAAWLNNKPAGLYHMADVLGFNSKH